MTPTVYINNITSPALFLYISSDKGMRYMVGKDWRDFFDVVIVQADKPHFFNDCVKWVQRWAEVPKVEFWLIDLAE